LRDLSQPAWWKKGAPAPMEPGELPDITVQPVGNDRDRSDSPTRQYIVFHETDHIKGEGAEWAAWGGELPVCFRSAGERSGRSADGRV
jgi:hypothetical protein